MKLPTNFTFYVPKEGEEVDFSDHCTFSSTASEEAMDDGKVNINTADAEKLMTIPGIGPSKATAIIQYRDEHGPFDSPEAIMEVSGIGQKTLKDLNLSFR